MDTLKITLEMLFAVGGHRHASLTGGRAWACARALDHGSSVRHPSPVWRTAHLRHARRCAIPVRLSSNSSWCGASSSSCWDRFRHAPIVFTDDDVESHGDDVLGAGAPASCSVTAPASRLPSSSESAWNRSSRSPLLRRSSTTRSGCDVRTLRTGAGGPTRLRANSTASRRCRLPILARLVLCRRSLGLAFTELRGAGDSLPTVASVWLQPVVSRLARSAMPPFFRRPCDASARVPLGIVSVGSINDGLAVPAASLFPPGGALVVGDAGSHRGIHRGSGPPCLAEPFSLERGWPRGPVSRWLRARTWA